jgi:hypothetical protein
LATRKKTAGTLIQLYLCTVCRKGQTILCFSPFNSINRNCSKLWLSECSFCTYFKYIVEYFNTVVNCTTHGLTEAAVKPPYILYITVRFIVQSTVYVRCTLYSTKTLFTIQIMTLILNDLPLALRGQIQPRETLPDISLCWAESPCVCDGGSSNAVTRRECEGERGGDNGYRLTCSKRFSVHSTAGYAVHFLLYEINMTQVKISAMNGIQIKRHST